MSSAMKNSIRLGAADPWGARRFLALASFIIGAMAFGCRDRPAIETGPASVPAPSSSSHQPTPGFVFVDVAATAGLMLAHENGADGSFCLVETMGSGVGWIDFDRDGWLDLLILNGCPLPVDPGRPGPGARLYRNRRDGTFDDVTERAGIRFVGYGQGVAVGDYDGDGWDDFYISAFGPGALYRNRGDGTFEDRTRAAGVAGEGWGSSCAFADLDGDGDLDLFVVRYLAGTVAADGSPAANCSAVGGKLGYCPPHIFAPETGLLFRNNGDGTFADVSADSGIASVSGNGLGLAIADFDDDRRLDIFVANDQMPNFLFRNLGGLRFEEAATRWGLAYDEGGRTQASMGIGAGDYDGDGRTDLFITNFTEEPDNLYRNVAPGAFQVMTAVARLSAPSRRTLGFGTGCFDFDNDGRPDLFVSNGHINDVRPLGMAYAMSPQAYRNRDGRVFDDVSSRCGEYFRGEWLGRGAAFGDYDNDGDVDVVVTHLGRPPALLRNDTPSAGRAVRLTLRGKGTGSRPIGAMVRADAGGRSIQRVLVGGTSYLAANDPRMLLAIDGVDQFDRIVITWPSGKTRELADVEAGAEIAVDEAAED